MTSSVTAGRIVLFTLWPSLTNRHGGHAEISWEDFRAFVSSPVVAANKDSLEGWSPGKFRGDARSKANVEAVSCIVLDDDRSGLSLEQVCAIWADVAGIVHSSHSHGPALSKWRIVLRASRDMTADEQERVWTAIAKHAEACGQVLDKATRDPSRFWFVPAHREGAPYEWSELTGSPLDVDALLALSVPTDGGANMARPRETAAGSTPERIPIAGGRRLAMASALRAAWPPRGRHEAQLALAGALRGEGWSAEDAVEFLTDVAGDRAKREKTVAHTWSRPEGAALTGWTRLKSFVDPVVVDAARSALGRDAEWTERTTRRLAELAAEPTQPLAEATDPEGLGFEFGVWDKEPPPTEFLVDGLLPRGCVGMFFGRADALKTWLLFSLGLAVASGKPWLNHYNVPKALRVGIVDFETGKANVDRRLFMLGAGTVTNLGRKSFAKLKPNDPEFWLALAAERFDLIIIDSLRRANPGANENESGEAIVPLELAAEFSEITRAAVLFIHHAKKDAADGWPEFRGSGAIEDQVDVSFAVKKTELSPALKTVEVRCEKPGDMVKPAPFAIEVAFDDVKRTAVMRRVEPPKPKDDEKAPEDANRELLLRILREHSAGVPKADAMNMLKGKNEARRQLVSSLLLSSIIVEYKADQGKIYLMLNPHTARG